MAYKIGTATDYKDLLTQLKDFVTTPNEISAAVADPGNTGDGTCSQPTAVDDAPTETWTLTATSATTFTVTGSVSGGKADATVGSSYNNGLVAFLITAGGTPFVASDEFTFTVTKIMGSDKWELLRWDTDYAGNSQYECWLKGPGSGGTDEIFVGVLTTENPTQPYFDWLFNGSTNFNSEIIDNFYGQQGTLTSTQCPWVLLDDDTMNYWFIANGRRIAGVVRVQGNIYENFYLGFPLVYGTPSSFPYPLIIAGCAGYSTNLNNKMVTSTDPSHLGLPNPSYWGQFRFLSGGWTSAANTGALDQDDTALTNTLWPGICNESEYDYYGRWPNHLLWWSDPTLDGQYPVFPLILTQSSPIRGIIGELEGVFHVFGDGVTSEDVITYAGKTYRVFQNTFRTNAHEYLALKME